ncbi:MAG: OmpA family protein [Hyphomicrobiaceae bacterium]
MRCKPSRWLWGLLPLALLAAAAILVGRGGIEADLQDRTRYALEEAGIDWAGSSFVGRDASMTGEAFDEGDRERALDIIRNTWGVRQAVDQAGLADEIRPYMWSATLEGSRLTMEGYAPDDSERRLLLDRVESVFRDASVDSRLEIGRGVPNRDRWRGAVEFALNQLVGLEAGEVSLSDLDLTIRGRARTVESFKTVKAALAGRLPRGVKLVSDAVTPPVADPYLLNVAFSGGRLSIDGHASDQAAIGAIADAAKRSFPGQRAEIKIEIAGGAPENWGDAAAILLEQMARLEEGFATIRNESIDFSGTAAEQDTAEAVETAVRENVPANFRAQANVSYKQARLAEVRPYTLNATYADGRLSIDGYAPDASSMAAIESEARRRFPTAAPEVKIELGAGAPDGWPDAVRGVLVELARLEEGFAALRDDTIDVTGTASDQATADEVKRTLETGMPTGFRSTASISAKAPEVAEISPYIFNVDYGSREVVLDGYVPSEADREALTRFVGRTFPGLQIVDRMQLGAGSPDGFREAAETGIEQLGRLDEGQMRMRDTDVEITGVAREQTVAESVRSELRGGLPGRYRSTERITVAEAEVPAIDPFVWSADFDSRRLVLDGYVPSEDARAEIVDEARRRLPNAEIDDRMQLGRSSIDEQIWLQRTDYALEQLGRLNPGRVELSNDRVTIRGAAIDSAAYRAAMTALKTMPPGLLLAKDDITAPVPAAFLWTLVARGNRVELGGFVPSEAARAELVGEVRQRFPGRQIDDLMEIAGGVDGPERDWLTAAALGVRAVTMVGEGEARLDGKRLTVTGTTDVEDLPGRIADLVGSSLPGGYDGSATIEYVGTSEAEIAKQKADEEARLAEEERLKEERTRNYRWSASYDGLRLEIDGSVPGGFERNRILARARDLLPNRTFDDRARDEDGAPVGWLDAVLAGLEQLARLESGRLEVVGLKITLHGTTDSEDTLARAKATMRSGLPRGYEGVDDVTYVAPPEPDVEEIQKTEASKKTVDVKTVEKKIETTTTPLEPKECEAVLNNRLRQGKLYFRRDSARLDGRDRKTLEPLLKVLERCEGSTILIAGHTDSDGAATYNQRLSEQRAQAVVDFLVSLGADRDRLTAIGYGETKPIVRNSGRANKAKNRRIEFEVQLR